MELGCPVQSIGGGLKAAIQCQCGHPAGKSSHLHSVMLIGALSKSSNVTSAYTLVNSQAQVEDLVLRINAEPWVAVDTEFMRESTYYPKLCLLQIGTEHWCDLVDPLADIELESLWLALYRPTLCKVFHAADQDLEIFTQLRGAPPPNLFDTQVAAPLLGHDEGMGYARLVDAVTGVSLSKDQTRADWSARPLSEAALRYAADDVIHLSTIYPRLTRELKRLQRDAWLEADWAKLENPAQYTRDPDSVGARLKGLDRLTPAQQARAQRLATWREREAQLRNQPKGWLINDSALLLVARRNPTDRSALKSIRDLKPAVFSAHADAILQTLANAPAEPEYAIRSRPKRNKDQHRRPLLDALSAQVALIAAEQAIHPDALASRALLDHWLDAPDQAFTPAWRNHLLFDQLNAFVAGQAVMRVNEGRLVLEPR